MAFGRSPLSSISSRRKAWRVGVSNEVTIPRSSARPIRNGTRTTSANVSAASVTAWKNAIDWITTRRRRRFTRSAHTPAIGERNSTGSCCAPAVMPSSSAEITGRRLPLEPADLGPDLVQRRGECREAIFFLSDDRRRSALDEAWIGELRVGLGDLPFEARNLLLQAHALRGGIDLELNHQVRVVDDRDR